ncbi:MAG TPA: RlmE family RNA methyltransferase [Dongiaceae bacterium]|nr:RlmE family RNA methyltransferase [Dongiaceae bacterium]
MSQRRSSGRGGQGSSRGGGGGNERNTARPSGRGLTVRVKTAGKRSVSSTRWLERQLNDPYVSEAKKQGYRSRAAFKLLQLDDKFHVLKEGARVVDLGAAPGGWCQVAVDRVGERGKVIGIDLLPMDPIPGADLIQMDFMTEEAPDVLKRLLDGGLATVVLSDMAASATGHSQTDHLKIMALAETAYDFAKDVLAKGGAFICKVLQGGATGELLKLLKRDFAEVKHVKPPASRSDSAEIYVVALGFRG